jgi:hypothetical protein
MKQRPVADSLGSMGSSARGTAKSFRNRVRYRFDRLLSRGTWAVLLWLGIITFVVVVFSAALLAISDVTLSGSESTSVAEDLWQSLLRVIDPGTMAKDVGWGRRILSLIVTLTGLLIAGTLIGLIAAGVEQRVERLRQGRSIVVESGHYVVLGWSEREARPGDRAERSSGDRRRGRFPTCCVGVSALGSQRGRRGAGRRSPPGHPRRRGADAGRRPVRRRRGQHRPVGQRAS